MKEHLGQIRKREREEMGWTLEEAVKFMNDDFLAKCGEELGLTVEALRKFEETGDVGDLVVEVITDND